MMQRPIVTLAVFMVFFTAGCDGNGGGKDGGHAWHYARDFVKVEPGTTIHRSCGKNWERDDTFQVENVRCIMVDNVERSDGRIVNAVAIQIVGNAGINATYIGEEPGIQTASVHGRGMTEVRMHTPDCGGDSYASTPHCQVELVHLERSEEVWSGPAGYDDASSLTLRVSCPEDLVGDFGDYTRDMRQTPTHLEFHAERCAVIHYPDPEDDPTLVGE